MAGMFKSDPETPEGKYLVTRRDGTVPVWPHFVVAASDPCAPHALRSYADIAAILGYDPQYVADVRRTADEFDKWRTAEPGRVGDPDAPCHRTDDPVTVDKMRGFCGGERVYGSFRRTLFMSGDFTLASGGKSKYKIECDALTPADWEGAAVMVVEKLTPFGSVMGVPRGGVPFALALQKHVTPGCDTILIAADVTTTGASMERYRNQLIAKEPDGLSGRRITGVVLFNRGKCPGWVMPVL